MYSDKGLGKLANENWHFDKYRDPHEFPVLNFSSDGEIDGSELGNESSSAHLSGKLPKVSDDEFKKLFHLRNERKRSGFSNNSNALNNIPALVFNEQSNLLDLKEDTKLEAPRHIETKENKLLSASTPKFNTVVTEDKEINGISSADKNLANLLSSTNSKEKVDASQFSKLLEKLEEQAVRINELQTQLTKTEIQKKNSEMEIVKLQNDYATLNNSNTLYEEEINILKRNRSLLEMNFNEVQAKKMDLEHQILTHCESSEKWKRELAKEKMLLHKERELNNSLISDHEKTISELKKEKASLSNSLELVKAQNENWEFKLEESANRLNDLNNSLASVTRDKDSIISDLKKQVIAEAGKHEEYEELKTHFNAVSSNFEAVSLDYKALKDKHNNLKTEKESLQSTYNDLKRKQEESSIESIKLKTELLTKLEIAREEMKNMTEKKRELENVINELEKEVGDRQKKYEDLKLKLLGTDPITRDRFGGFYQLLEMDKIDGLSLIELQNILKNILKSLNIKFSDLKQDIMFIRDEIFAFFTEIHSILHCSELNNKIILDKSIKLDLSDRERFKKCLDILLKDIKKLKGLE